MQCLANEDEKKNAKRKNFLKDDNRRNE